MKHNTDISTLRDLAARYFDGLTSLEEERFLRRSLPSVPDGVDPDIDALKAVMSFTGHDRRISRRRRAFRLTGGVAAAVAGVAVVIAAWQYSPPESIAADCTSYLASRVTTDPSAALDLMNDQLGAISLASEELALQVTDDVESLQNVFGTIEITQP